MAHGYEVEDARDYVVAACWEFIIPGRGMEVVNTGAVSFPAAVDQALREGLTVKDDFDQILDRVKVHVREQVNCLADAYSHLLLPPAPYYSIFIRDCLEQGRDLSKDLKYNNFGIHGAGSSNAADALAAVQKFVFEEQSISPEELLSALDIDFNGCEPLRRKLEDQGPKVGNNDSFVDTLLVTLFDDLADACEEHPPTPRAASCGRERVPLCTISGWLEDMRECANRWSVRLPMGDCKGNPSAPIWPPRPVCACADRSVHCNLLPRSTISAFAMAGRSRWSFQNSVFRDQESVRKTAMLVRTFAQLGCQQLQLNSLGLDTLLDAKANRKNHQEFDCARLGLERLFL